MAELRLVVAEDNLLVREGLVSLLSTAGDLLTTTACTSLDELYEAVDRDAPDVVVTDIRMPPNHRDEGIQAARRFRTTHPRLGVVVLSQFVEPSYALALLEDGTRGRRLRPEGPGRRGRPPRPGDQDRRRGRLVHRRRRR